MTTHTPGPWRAGSVPTELRAEVYVTGGRHLANVYAALKTPDQATADANARLIAAAPDLLAALRGALLHVTLLGCGERPPYSNSEMIEQLSGAISKAVQP